MLRGNLLVALATLTSPIVAMYPVVGRTTGIDPNTGAIPQRRNINDLYNENAMEFSLYVRAVEAMQQADPSDPKSWFQVMGIHGYPDAPYDDEPDLTTGTVGYCPHSEEIFATWHRHYLTLYEQIIGEHAMRLAQIYPEEVRSEWIAAAERLRIPYWDWAYDSDIPPATLQEYIDVLVPGEHEGVPYTIKNPLYTYYYPDSVMNGDFGFTPSENQTLRCPDENGVPHPEKGSDKLRNIGLKNSVYSAFVRSKTFGTGLTMRGHGASIESPHGSIHVYAACGEDFAGVAMAGFDPLFMLHHCEVDRLISLWQVLNPDENTFNTTYNSYGTAFIPYQEEVNAESALGPFHQADGSYHTSTTATYTWDYGYVYPGVTPWNRTTDEMRQDMITLVNTMYDPDTTDNVTVTDGDSTVESRSPKKRETVTEFYAQISVEVDNFPRPCSLQLYLDDHHAGTYTLLGRPTTGTVYGEIPLQRAIKLAGIVNDGDMLNSITKNMTVRFEKPDGTVIPANQTGNYTMHIEQVDVVKPSCPSELPEFGIGEFFEMIPKLIDIDIDFGDADTAPSFSLSLFGAEITIGGGSISSTTSSVVPTSTTTAAASKKTKASCVAKKSAPIFGAAGAGY